MSRGFQQGLYETIISMAYDNGHDEEQPHVCDMARKDDWQTVRLSGVQQGTTMWKGDYALQ